jgi:hypothetical protein
MKEALKFYKWILFNDEICDDEKFDTLKRFDFNIWRQDYLVSTNVRRIAFDDERNQLWVQFMNGDTYVYNGVSFLQFLNIVNGRNATRTAGPWGDVGKSPSVGAAIWQRLIDTKVPYEKVGKGFWIKKGKSL